MVIYVDDVNDNSPSFPSQVAQLTFSEGSTPGKLKRGSVDKSYPTVPLSPAKSLSSHFLRVPRQVNEREGPSIKAIQQSLLPQPSRSTLILWGSTPGKLKRKSVNKSYTTVPLSPVKLLTAQLTFSQGFTPGKLKRESVIKSYAAVPPSPAKLLSYHFPRSPCQYKVKQGSSIKNVP